MEKAPRQSSFPPSGLQWKRTGALAFGLACLCLAGGVCSDQSAESSSEAITVPYAAVEGRLPAVSVELENKRTARFLFDTGSGLSIINETLADELGLERYTPDNAAPIRGFTNPDWVRALQFRLGGPKGYRLERAPLMVLPRKVSPSLTGGLDGIVGLNVLIHFAIKLNPQKREIKLFHRGWLTEGQIAAEGFDVQSAVPLKPNKRAGCFDVTCSLNGKFAEDLGVDTGGLWTVIAPASAKSLKLKSKETVKVGTLSGSLSHQRAILASFSLGGITEPDFPVLFLKDERSQDEVGGSTSLGMDFLSRATCLIDYPSGKMYLRKLEAQ